jgi:hypothetical protein
MNEQFNDWWNGDDLTTDNPFKQDTPAFWAWEGWVASQNAKRKEVLDLLMLLHERDKEKHN